MGKKVIIVFISLFVSILVSCQLSPSSSQEESSAHRNTREECFLALRDHSSYIQGTVSEYIPGEYLTMIGRDGKSYKVLLPDQHRVCGQNAPISLLPFQLGSHYIVFEGPVAETGDPVTIFIDTDSLVEENGYMVPGIVKDIMIHYGHYSYEQQLEIMNTMCDRLLYVFDNLTEKTILLPEEAILKVRHDMGEDEIERIDDPFHITYCGDNYVYIFDSFHFSSTFGLDKDSYVEFMLFVSGCPEIVESSIARAECWWENIEREYSQPYISFTIQVLPRESYINSIVSYKAYSWCEVYNTGEIKYANH